MLARDLGIVSVRELGSRLSGREFNGWIAFYEIDGILQSRMAKGDKPQAALEYARVLEELRTD